MLNTTMTFRVVFWRCIANVLEKSLQLRPMLKQVMPYLPYLIGGLAAFLLGTVAGKAVLLLIG